MHPCVVQSSSSGFVQEETIQHIVITFDQQYNLPGPYNGETMMSIFVNKVKTNLGTQFMEGNWIDPYSTTDWNNNFSTDWVKGHKLELFGNKRATVDPANYAHWPGTIYMIAMYDRVLTPTEIAANYDAGSGTITTIRYVFMCILRYMTCIMVYLDPASIQLLLT